MPIKGDTALSSFSGKELAESSAIHGDFNQASINYSGHQNLEVRGAEDMDGTPRFIPVEVIKYDAWWSRKYGREYNPTLVGNDYDYSYVVCVRDIPIAHFDTKENAENHANTVRTAISVLGGMTDSTIDHPLALKEMLADWDVSVDKVTHQKQTFHVKDKDYESQAKRKALSLAKKKKGGWKNYPEGAGFATPEYEAWFARRARAESFGAELVGGPCEICGEDLFRDYDDSMGDVCLSCYYEERSKQDDEGSEYDGWLLNFAESFGADRECEDCGISGLMENTIYCDTCWESHGKNLSAEYGKRQRFGNRYVARDTKGRIISNVSVGRSLKADRRNKSKTPARSGFGHMGDARKGASGEFKLPTNAKSLVGIGAVLGGLWAYLESKA